MSVRERSVTSSGAPRAPAGRVRWAWLVLFLGVACARNLRPDGAGEEGEASWYGPGLYGRKTASGEVLRQGTLTAAHRTLPFGTCLRVTNLENGQVVEVRVNDRGPYAGNRIVDLSEAAARALGMHGRGVTRVRLERCGGSTDLDRPGGEMVSARWCQTPLTRVQWLRRRGGARKATPPLDDRRARQLHAHPLPRRRATG